MIMFLSSFFGIIDSKNRIAIPSSYRATIKETKEKVYLFKSLKYSCLEIHLASKINSLVKSFDEKDFFSKKNNGLDFLRILASIILIITINIFLGKKTSDPMAGFFLFKKKIFLKSKHKFYKKGYKILADIIYLDKNKVLVNDVKINFKKRKHGKSKINFKVLIYLIYFIFKKIFS